VRASLALVALIVLAAGCSSSKGSPRSVPNAGSLEALWRASGQSVALIAGLVGRDGMIKAKFEGSLAMTGMGQAIRRLLL